MPCFAEATQGNLRLNLIERLWYYIVRLFSKAGLPTEALAKVGGGGGSRTRRLLSTNLLLNGLLRIPRQPPHHHYERCQIRK
ncbi:MAG: hypothetical protein KJO34_07590, partial [Deltaproteobacteria bacterium]|nr:hypothetical protein [Deltaproteobacteria bacterium]